MTKGSGEASSTTPTAAPRKTPPDMRTPGGGAGAPTSLEAERRKAMMLCHSAEKDLLNFREKHFRRPRNRFSSPEAGDLVKRVARTCDSRQPPRTHGEFRKHYEQTRGSLEVLYPRQVAHMDAALDRAAAFDELVVTVRQKLHDALEDHVGKYCHSFSPEAGDNEIGCVQEYENNITRWRAVIRDSVSLLEDILKSLSEAGPSFETYIASYDKILHYMHLALEVFPRVYNLLKDWVTSDEAYVRKLQDEANDVLRRKVQVMERMRKGTLMADDMQTKVCRNHHQTTKLKERLSRALDQRKFCRRQEIILVDSQLNEEIKHKKQELDECLHGYYSRAANYSHTMYTRVMTKASSCQEELSRLEKRQDAIQVNVSKVHKERLAVQKEVHKLQTMFERSNKAGGLASLDAEERARDLREQQDENKALADKLSALRTIRAIKLSPNTIRKIHTEGYTPGRKLSVIDPFVEACKVTASDIGKDWAFLYNKLPFSPERDLISRSHDIQVIDIGSQKKDAGLRGAAIRSLEKWKRLSQDASVSVLVRTLRTIKKQAVANKIEKHIDALTA